MRHRGSVRVRWLLACACSCLALTVPACSRGPQVFKVEGKLVFKGEPYLVTHSGSIGVKFTQVVEEKQPFKAFIAELDRKKGTFTVPGDAGQGIPAGKYRISIFQLMIDAPPELLELNQRFSDENSQVLREVPSDAPLIVDLSRPEG